jgi:hypothetical protein
MLIRGQGRYSAKWPKRTASWSRGLDDKGVEVTDPDEARMHALEAIWELIQEGEEVSNWRGWRLEVANASGTVLFLIQLDALPS